MIEGVDTPILNGLFEEVEALRHRAEKAEAEREADRRTYEAMRPHWAKGYSSDSIAAQSSTYDLTQLWEILGVENQTAAVIRLKWIMEFFKSKGGAL